ncbi:Hypothetical predicted protein, partial [Marmota monax]
TPESILRANVKNNMIYTHLLLGDPERHDPRQVEKIKLFYLQFQAAGDTPG